MKKRTYRLLCVLASTVLLVTGALTGCSSSGKSGVSKGDGTQQTEENGAEEKKAPKIDGLKYQKTMQLNMPQVLMFTIIKVDINYWMCMMTDSI